MKSWDPKRWDLPGRGVVYMELQAKLKRDPTEEEIKEEFDRLESLLSDVINRHIDEHRGK